MLERIHELPNNIWGLRAKGEVTKDDYDRVVTPTIEEARREGRRLRFLYQLGPEFSRFTPSAAWEDVRIGLRNVDLFERCAVVSDVDWIRTASRAEATVMPFPLQVFSNSEWQQAIDWLSAQPRATADHRMMRELEVLVIEPRKRLRIEDFSAISATLDSWLEESGGTLQGLVLCARRFPGWENVGAAMRHFQFVRKYHRRINRVAWAIDGELVGVLAKLTGSLLRTNVRHFNSGELPAAIEWASGRKKRASLDGQPARPAETLQP